jgi:hypothetical protein
MMNPKYRSVILFLCVLVFAVGLVVNYVHKESISGLVKYFNAHGLHATEYTAPMNETEKNAVKAADDFVKDLQQASGASPVNVIDKQSILIGGIVVQITQYQNPDDAKKYFTNLVSAQERRKERALASNTPYDYDEVDFMLNGQFLGRIDHYEVRMEEGRPGIIKTVLKLDPAAIANIKSVFEAY